MRVTITGATGFVGGHTVAAALAAGHEVTALVRDPQRLERNLAALGADIPHHVVGDMTDAVAVAEAMAGAEAVIHSAAVVSIDLRHGTDMAQANPEGLRIVVEAAMEVGADPIVTTSSTSALFTPGIGPLNENSPVATPRLAYAASKAAADRVARRFQDDGAPVAITYPAGILGPPAGDAFGETAVQMAKVIDSGLIPIRRAALSLIDVRDLAAAQVALLTPGRGPRRIMCGGHFLDMETLAAHLRGLTGRRFPIVPIPPGAVVGLGRTVDRARSRFANASFIADSPISEEGMRLVCGWSGTDDSTLHELGITPRPVDETLAASIDAWKHAGMIRDSVRSFSVPSSYMSAPLFRRYAPTVVPKLHRAAVKMTGGRTMFDSAAQPMLMLTTIGRKSGLERQTPLAAVPAGSGRFYIVGSNFAQAAHPAWTANLLADPACQVTYRGRTTAMTARRIDGEELDSLWPELLRWYPNWADYTEITDRKFRVFELSAVG